MASSKPCTCKAAALLMSDSISEHVWFTREAFAGAKFIWSDDLDLDNTVWGGVIGDDGVEGVEGGEGVFLTHLPRLADGHTPVLSYIPDFLLTLARRV